MKPEIFAHGYGLLIGVGESACLDWSSRSTANSARALKRIITDPGICAYPDDDEHIHLLYDSSATRPAIRDGLTWLARCAKTDAEATVIIYFSGHGWLNKANGKYFLVPHESTPLDLIDSALSAQEFTKAVQKVAAKRLLVILDCCHAEGMTTSEAMERSELVLPGIEEPAVSASGHIPLIEGEGRAVLGSSGSARRSWHLPDDSLTLFTYHLLQAFQGAGNQPGDTLVRVSNIVSHLSKNVPDTALIMDHVQKPFFRMNGQDFAVAMLRGGKGLPAEGWESIREEAAATIRRVVQAIGTGSIAIGGDVNNSAITVGQGNIVQHGKYNLQIDHAEGSAFGDQARVDYRGNGVAPSSKPGPTERGTEADEIGRTFALLMRIVNASPDGSPKDDAREAVQKLEAEARRGEQAEESRALRWFTLLGDASQDVWQVAVTILANPIAGISGSYRNAARQSKAQRSG